MYYIQVPSTLIIFLCYTTITPHTIQSVITWNKKDNSLSKRLKIKGKVGKKITLIIKIK